MMQTLTSKVYKIIVEDFETKSQRDFLIVSDFLDVSVMVTELRKKINLK